jgi:hypothetical protein
MSGWSAQNGGRRTATLATSACVSLVDSISRRGHQCGVVCIGMREDTHVNMLPSPNGLVLGMEHKLSDWTSWLEMRRPGKCSRSWPVTLLPEDCWERCSSLGPARWGVFFSEARWSRREDLADSNLSLGFHVSRRSLDVFLCVRSKTSSQ